MPTNYYLTLGIPADASLEDIKNAYRRLVKKFHPDSYPKNSTPFLNIQKAYSILSDPVKRNSYDHLGEDTRRETERPKFRPARRPVIDEIEPLIPNERSPAMVKASLARSFHSYHPSFDELFGRVLGNFSILPRPKQEKLEELNVVITLTPEQAFTGGHVQLMVPSHSSCPSCRGKGGFGVYACWRCGGEAAVVGEQPVLIHYPARMPDNHTVQLSLNRFGIYNSYLTVQFRVSEVV